MTRRTSTLPRFFKGIALFTPGGDLVYGIDAKKQVRWHLHLCLALQEVFELSEPPYFLLPGYTATLDRWQNYQTGKIEVCAEVYPPVARYIPLLRVLFGIEHHWQVVPWQEEHCHPAIIETYRQEFPQLWEERNIVMRLDSDNPHGNTRKIFPDLVNIKSKTANSPLNHYSSASALRHQQNNRVYVLLLFIAGNNLEINQTLDNIHQILEGGLSQPYNLKIIDITKNPEQAETHQVSATPTLVRIWPKPVKRIVGDLANIEQIIKIISS